MHLVADQLASGTAEAPLQLDEGPAAQLRCAGHGEDARGTFARTCSGRGGVEMIGARGGFLFIDPSLL